MPPLPPIALPNTTSIPADRMAVLKQKSQELEAAFLSEMLSFAGLGETGSGFSGGVGEEQFSSFLRAEQAKLMVAKGGIGLAEQIFQSLVRHENG